LPNKDGYPQIQLFKGRIRKSIKVHRLVAAAFLGVCPPGHEVNHKDGNKTNSTAENLEYVTKSENLKHAYRNGFRKPVHFSGERNPMAKLTNDQVIQIREMRRRGVSSKELVKIFGISRSRLYVVWKDLAIRDERS
jgi:hypothetical protein